MGINIFYLCPDIAEPAGGVKVIYRHVEMLCRNGVSAYVVHANKGFRCDWFENDVPVRTFNGLQPTQHDYLVLPAIWALQLIEFAPRVKKVIINQGAYLTFSGYPIVGGTLKTPYLNPDVMAVMVVSEDSQRYLQYVFPDLKVMRVRNYIDPVCFPFSKEKKKKIAFFTRKRYQDIEQVINILRFRGVLDSFALAPIEGKSEQGVSSILQESLLFMNYCLEEGWSLPAAEAMSCGCVVVGNHGYGAREIMLPEFSYPVEQGDVIQFARNMEKVILQYKNDPRVLQEKASRGAKFINSNYSPSVAEQDLLSFWKEMIDGVTI